MCWPSHSWEVYTTESGATSCLKHKGCMSCWTVTLVLLLAWTDCGTVYMKWTPCWENTYWIALYQNGKEEIFLYLQIVSHGRVGCIPPPQHFKSRTGFGILTVSPLVLLVSTVPMTSCMFIGMVTACRLYSLLFFGSSGVFFLFSLTFPSKSVLMYNSFSNIVGD